MVDIAEGAVGAAPAKARDSARALLWRLIWLYGLGSAAAVVVTFFLAAIGLEFTLEQWLKFLISLPVGLSLYLAPDVYVIQRHSAKIREALRALDRGGRLSEDDMAAALVQALNLPFLSFMRVTFVHGPAATAALCILLMGLNTWFDGNFAAWQIWAFAATVMFFASPTHAIFEYFAVSRDIVPVVERLTREVGALPPEHQRRLIAIRLKTKLLYLAIFVASAPLVFFAFSIVFKVDRLLLGLGLDIGVRTLWPLYVWIAGVIGVCIMGSLVMAILTAREVSRSAARMIEAMGQVEQGQLDRVRLDVTSTDEYADLYRGFNLMLESLREEQRILEVSHDLAGELQLDVLIARIMTATTELLGAERSTLFVYDPKTDELFSRYAEGLDTKEIRIPANQGIAGAVFAAGRVENIADPYADPRFNPEIDRRTGFTTKSILCMPIVNKAGARIGVTQVLNKRGGVFTAKDEARLRAFTAQIAVSLENAQLFDDVLNMKNYNDSILKSTTNGIVTLDAEGRIVTVNEATLELLHARREAMVGMPASEIFSGPNAWVMESIRRTERTGEPALAVDAQIARADGEPASVNFTAMPLIDIAEERIGSMLVLEDITAEKRVRSTMARYMSKEVADQLLAAGEAELGGKDQKVSILFSDVRSFTTISEALGARETVSMLNEYFAEMVDVIFQNGGILDKYIGDAIMALFGAPFNGPEDADNALATANDMMVRLAALNRKRAAEGKRPLEIGVGVSTGDVVVGNIGSPKRMEYTVIGDSVNLASRLEGVNKYYGSKILLSEFTVRDLKREALLREVDLMRVKGKDRPVAVYEALGYRQADLSRGLGAMLESYGRGLEAYRRRDWTGAMAAFAAALEAEPADGVSAMYLERCRVYAETPPPVDWDGVWVLKEK